MGAIATFRRSERAVAMIEFALVLPLLVLLLMGGAEVERYIRFARHLQTAANTAAQVLSTAPGPLDYDHLHGSLDAVVPFVFPELVQDATQNGVGFWEDYAWQVTFVYMKPSGSTYAPNVTFDWYNDLASAAGLLRSCGVLGLKAGEPTPTTIDPSLVQPGSLIIVDMQFIYKPLFGSQFLGSIPITVHAVTSPRYVTPYLTYSRPNAGLSCPGF